MSTIYRYIFYMLALFTAKSYEELSTTAIDGSGGGNEKIQLINDLKWIHNHNNINNNKVLQMPLLPSMQQQLKYEQDLKQHHNQPQQYQNPEIHYKISKPFSNDKIIENSYRKYYSSSSLSLLPQPEAQYQSFKSASELEEPQKRIDNEKLQYFFNNNNNNNNGGINSKLNTKLTSFSSTNFNFLGSKNPDSPIRSSSSSSTNNDINHNNCGGILTKSNGIIQTPNFPNKFNTPIQCIWIIDASEYFNSGQNISIILYLNQLYVLGGLKFTEYMYYSDDFKVPSHRIFELNEDDVTQVTWIQFTSQYLEIKFDMRTLDGTHLRALNRFLDVYGFNITYEIDTNIKSYQCNVLKCHFLGHCYAKNDFSSYYCSCFSGSTGGKDCSKGPLCERNHCENGGICKHIGDAAVTCICPKGFHGNQCEIPEIEEITTVCSLNRSSKCHHYCSLQDPVNAMNNGCKCNTTKGPGNDKASNRSGKTRFEVTIRLGSNLTALYRAAENQNNNSDKKLSEHHLPSLLEKHMSRVLRNFNITKVNDLELISNSSKRLDITFHFFGVKSDSNRIREAITRMVERGRLGNITLVSNYHLFDENPPLELQNVIINKKSPIRENTEFIISCIAQGSSKIEFQWFKDGIPVNASKATRDIWTIILPPEQENVYTSILGVSKANRLDEGVYTCKVIDWGVELCRSIHIYIQTPPNLEVDPASITLYRGDSLRVRCLSPGNNNKRQQRYGNIGYSWTRNGVLFQSNPNTAMWEDLYPDGSILKIQNIQKSAEYSCIVSNSVSPVSKSIYVTVIDKGIVELCTSEKRYNINWPASAPGAPILTKCPNNFEGYTKRVCEQRDINVSNWLEADFSNCKSNQLLDIFNEFRTLTLGYQKTNCSTILKSCLEYAIKRHTEFFPGEAGFLMDILQEVENYLKIKGTHLEREMAAEIILHILDKVMQNVASLNSQQQIKKFQLLTQSAALNRETIAASQLATSTSTSSGAVISSSGSAVSSSSVVTNARDSTITNRKSPLDHSVITIADSALTSERLNSFRIYTTSIKTLPFNLRIYGDDLFSDQLYMDIRLTNKLMEIMSNGTIFASVISYKNLTSFLPKTYYSRGSDISGDYMPASRIIATWLFQSNRSNDHFVEPLNLPLESGHVEIIFQHESIPKNTDWIPICGHETRATFESTWRTDLCITKNLMENMTRCICPLSGTFVVLLARKNYNTLIVNRTSTRPIFLIISCGCCFLQSCIAFAILIPVLYNRKCCVTFLKMQFCTATSTVMAIFLLGFLKLLPQDWHSIISSTLGSLMLLGISTLVAVPLVIQSELIPKKAQMDIHNNLSTGGIRGAIGISWLLPILFAICSPLIYSIIGKWPIYWWLEYPTSGFILYIIIEILFIILFILLFVTLLSKLLWLIKKNDKQNISIWRRIGLLYRTGIILFLKLITYSLFLTYWNTNNNSIISHCFGISCIILGFAILFCFVIKAEYTLRSTEHISTGSHLKKTSTKTSLEDNYCSGSINSALSFYANHEKEKDNESSPLPLKIISTSSRCPIQHQQQQHKQITTKSSVETFLGVVGGVGGNQNGNGNTIVLTTTNGDKKTSLCDISLHEMEQQIPSTTILEKGRKSLDNFTNNSSSSNSNCDNGTKSRCCNILGTSSSNNKNTKHLGEMWEDGLNSQSGGVSGSEGVIGFYDTYHHHQDPQITTLPENHEFVGVETLDILQGVAPDSIIGIRTSGMLNKSLPTHQYYNGNSHHHNIHQQQQQQQQQDHKSFITETLIATTTTTTTKISGIPIISGVPNSNTNNSIGNNLGNFITTTTSSVTTQTPKLKKRVTIVEEPKISSQLPSNNTTTTISSSSSVPPIITITTTPSIDENDPGGKQQQISSISHSMNPSNSNNKSDDILNNRGSCTNSSNNDIIYSKNGNRIDGMLDRISHDLDYLLNRTTEILSNQNNDDNDDDDDDIPPPPLPPTTLPPLCSNNLPLPPPPPSLQQSSAVLSNLSSSSQLSRNVHHDVIIEESEQE